MASIRCLGGPESFYEAAYQTLGSFNLSATFTLSAPISLPQLHICAHYLRTRHQILRSSIRLDWDNKVAHYIPAPHLQPQLSQYDGPLSVEQHAQILTDGQFPPHFSDEQRCHFRLDARNNFLPWSLILSGQRANHIVFVASHSICDGVSFDIIGADIVRALNGQKVLDEILIAPPTETLFGAITIFDRLKAFWNYFRALNRSLVHVAKGSENWTTDWKLRKTVGCTLEMSLNEMTNYLNRCKTQNVSINSGIISTVYEVVGNIQELNYSGKQIPLYVSMDTRRRVPQGSPLSLDNIGCYIGGGLVYQECRNGQWAERAKSVHHQVHSMPENKAFKENQLLARLSLMSGQKLMYELAGKEFGRFYEMVVSNVGRAVRIEKANEECESQGDGRPVVKIERMRYDDSQQAIGTYILLQVSTVGNNISFVIRSWEPFMSQGVVDEITRELEMKLKE